MTFDKVAEAVGVAFEVVAVLVLVSGFCLAAIRGAGTWRQSHDARRAYRTLREVLGGGLLVALEILVAADLVGTVAVDPTGRTSRCWA